VAVRTTAGRGEMASAAALIEHAELLGDERGWQRLLAMTMVDRAYLGLPQTMAADALLATRDEAAAIAEPLSLPARIFAILAELRVAEAIAAGDPRRVAEICQRLTLLGEASGNSELRARSDMLGMVAGLALEGMPDAPAEAAGQVAGALRAGFRRTLIDVVQTVVAGGRQLRPAPRTWPPAVGLLVDAVAARRAAPLATVLASPEPPTATLFSILTSREIDVLTGVSCGESNKDIARQLHLTPETVKWHLKNVMRKLGAESCAEAVQRAAALGLSLAPD